MAINYRNKAYSDTSKHRKLANKDKPVTGFYPTGKQLAQAWANWDGRKARANKIKQAKG